ncbi:MAG TPA: PAS domain S-box protein, partial [Dehalococcoidia bacterium]|nr:PAS domain S-box protein [Dehalococcoidia bacterium]
RAELLQMELGDIVAARPDRAGAAPCVPGDDWRGEVELRRKDGTLVPVEAWLRAVTLPGRTIYISGARDITDRLETEDALRELARLEGVVAAGREISHEMTTSLAVAIGNLELIHEWRDLPEEVRRRVHTAMVSLEATADAIRKFHRTARRRAAVQGSFGAGPTPPPDAAGTGRELLSDAHENDGAA